MGLAIGSFLNVVISRVPRGMSIAAPRSRCLDCDAVIAWYDNVPVLSWLILRGRCRVCHRRISQRYVVVEMLTAVLFVATATKFGYSWPLPGFLVFVAGLIALAFTDLEYRLLPVRVLYPVLFGLVALLTTASIVTHDWHRMVVAAASGVAWFAVFFSVHAIKPRLLGFGDVRLASVLGFGLGWLGVGYVLIGFYVANVLGAVVGVSLLVARRAARETPMPYGVFLAAGAFVSVLAGSPLIAGIRSL